MKMMSRALLATAAVALTAGLAAPAGAQGIVLRPDDSFTNAPGGAEALYAFRKAANYWNQTLGYNGQQINIQVSYQELPQYVIGSTGSNAQDRSTTAIYQALQARSATALDATAVANLVPLSASGGLGFIRSAALNGNALTGTDLNTQRLVYDNNNSNNNQVMYVNTANLKALGFDIGSNVIDAQVTFSSAFSFDFDPRNGIGAGQEDFVAVATHELGHALGFVSGSDYYDYYGSPNGPAAGLGIRWDRESVLTPLDLFRYASNYFNPATGKRYLDLAPGTGAIFSLDGTTPFSSGASGSRFSTGAFNGDGSQTSHWKDTESYTDANGCYVGFGDQVGIMDPTSDYCQQGVVTGNDLAAFDAIGYNLKFDVTQNKGYTFSTAQIYNLAGLASVPEPSTWALMIMGFGAVGGTMRRRRVKTTVRFA